MEISKEQKEAIEYLEKYTKWETYGERNLEKDIITVLGLLNEKQMENETLEELLQGTLYEMYKYYRDLANSYQGNCISKEKVKDKIEDLKMSGGSDGKDNTENTARELAIEALQNILEESEI